MVRLHAAKPVPRQHAFVFTHDQLAMSGSHDRARWSLEGTQDCPMTSARR